MHIFQTGTATIGTVGSMLVEGTKTHCYSQIEAIALGNARLQVYQGTAGLSRTFLACQAKEVAFGAITADIESYCLP